MIKRKYEECELLNYIERTPNITNYEDKEIFIHLDSFCLGDTICFSCFLEPFLNYHYPKKILVSTFFPHIFESYNNKIEFINSNQKKKVIVDKLINVGYDKKKLSHTFGGMAYAAKDCLFLPQEIKFTNPPVIKKSRNIIENKITIGPESIKKIAKWNFDKGWQTVVDYLYNKNYVLYNISYEKTLNLRNVYNLNGYNNINVALQHILQSKIFVGLSSGLSWLAWAYKVPVVMISNFTKNHNEFDCFRVENRKVCNGCFNVFADIRCQCPLWEGTQRENECHNKITPEMVIEKIEESLKDDYRYFL